MKNLLPLTVIFQIIGATSIVASSVDNSITIADHSSIVLKNNEDLTWEKMLPELGENSPIFSILRVDPKTKETTLKIHFPKAIYIPKHTHNKSETHILLGGTHLFEHNGKRYKVKEHGYIYM
jgi:quercetin dioxygenase-like cupin family protein